MPKECIEESKYDNNRNKKTKKHGAKIPTLLYRNEASEENYIRKCVYGGRVCPRMLKL